MKVSDFKSSRYITAANLQGNQVHVTISQITAEEVGEDTKAVAYFTGKEKGWVLNVTNMGRIEDYFGSDDLDHWIGAQVTLYPDKDTFKGKIVDCIRVRIPDTPSNQQMKANIRAAMLREAEAHAQAEPAAAAEEWNGDTTIGSAGFGSDEPPPPGDGDAPLGEGEEIPF